MKRLIPVLLASSGLVAIWLYALLTLDANKYIVAVGLAVFSVSLFLSTAKYASE